MPQVVTYRLTIRNASTVANPNGTADELVLTSIPAGTNPYIAAPPSGDGAEVDPLTGAVRTGAYVVEVVDADTGTDGTGTLRVVTNKLEDATFRQQLLSRRAYLDVLRDSVSTPLIAGYISSIRLISPMRYAITIGDTRRVERTQTIFQGSALGGYTIRGCFTGGPVTADFGTIKSRGGWKYAITSKSNNDVTLEFREGYQPAQNSPLIRDWLQVDRTRIVELIENYSQFFVAPDFTTPVSTAYLLGQQYTQTAYSAATNQWEVSGGIVVWAGTNPATIAPIRALLCMGPNGDAAQIGLGSFTLPLYWPSCPYSVGQELFISLTTFDVNENCPLYLDAHPVDLVTAIWSNARVRYDTGGAWITTIRNLIGPNVRLACRFPQAPNMDEFLQQAIYGPFGISERTTTAGNQELFPTRIKTTTTPTLTLTSAAMRGADEVVFDLDEQTAVSGVRLTQQVLSPKVYIPQQATQNGSPVGSQNEGPIDGVLVSEVTQTAQYIDPNLAVFAGKVIEYRIPGMIHTASDFVPNTSAQLDAIAIGTFDRFGRGCQSSEVSVLSTAAVAAAQLGDEIYYEAPHFPNKGYRIGESTVGPRIMQIVRRTETPAGPVFRLLDSGLAAQPVSPAATISIAQNPTATTSTARFTITNAATLNATGVLQVRIEWAVGTTTPTGNGADFAFYGAGEIPTGAVDLPPATTPGQTVYVRARTEQAGRRPSAWTAWTGVTLATIPIISSLSGSNIRQTAATVSWTNGSSTLPLAVFAYQGSSAPFNWLPYRVGTVPAGTTSTVVRNLTGPSLPWTIGLAYETAQALGTVVSTTVTTDSTLDSPTRPAGLAVIPGVDDVTLTQGIALALWASDQTLNIQIQRSTTSGSGFATIATVAGSTSVYIDQRPRDGTVYYYKIAHVLGGYTVSSYTGEVSGTATGVPVNVRRPGAVAPVVRVETTETTTTGTVLLNITDPQQRVTRVRFRDRTDGGAWGAWRIDSAAPYSDTVTLPAAGFIEVEYEVTGFDTAGTAAQILANGIEAFDVGGVANLVSVVGTFTTAGALALAVQCDTDTLSFKYAHQTTAWASDAAAYSAAQAGTLVNARNGTVTLSGPYAVGDTVYLAFAAYTGASGAGTVSGPYRYQFTNGSTQPPSIKVVTTPGASTYSLLVTWTGTIAYALDGATQSVTGWTSPRTVTITRTEIGTNAQVAAFSVLKDGITMSESVNIPALELTSASLTIGTQTADDTTETYEFDWTASGFPTGTTYDLNYRTVTTAGNVEEGYYSGLTATNQDVVSGYNIGASPTYQMTVSAVKSGSVLMTRSRTGTFLT